MKNTYKTSRFVIKYAKRLSCFTRMVPQMENKHKYKESLKTRNNTIKQVTAKRMLGAIIDEKLTFKDHIKHICMQAK